MGLIQIEHLKDGVICGLILTLDDGIIHAPLFYSPVILKHGLAAQADPGILWAGNRNLYIGVGLHILIDILPVVSAEPQFAILFKAEHKGTALGLSIASHSGQILNGVGRQKFNNFFHIIPSCFLQLDLCLACF